MQAGGEGIGVNRLELRKKVHGIVNDLISEKDVVSPLDVFLRLGFRGLQY